MAKVSQEDAFLYSFLKKDFGDPFKGKLVNPDKLKYSSPDFGFDNFLNFDQVDMSKAGEFSPGWRLLQDYSSPFPRYERLKNYINCVNEEKFRADAKKFQKANSFRRTSTLVNRLTARMNPKDSFETMQRLRAAIAQNLV